MPNISGQLSTSIDAPVLSTAAELVRAQASFVVADIGTMSVLLAMQAMGLLLTDSAVYCHFRSAGQLQDMRSHARSVWADRPSAAAALLAHILQSAHADLGTGLRADMCQHMQYSDSAHEHTLLSFASPCCRSTTQACTPTSGRLRLGTLLGASALKGLYNSSRACCRTYLMALAS